MLWLKLEVLAVMGCYALIVGFILIGKWKIKKKSFVVDVSKINKNSLQDLSVIVPFRNEDENLKMLIYAIQQMKNKPLEFIFINDHSEDESAQILRSSDWNHTVHIIDLPEMQIGKKAAINLGVSLAKGKYILTWDADIFPSQNYFDSVEKLNWESLNILPVEMRDSGWISGFFAWDYQLQTQTALSVAGWNRPIAASGANLLIEKEAFVAVAKMRRDFDILSGDDQFLLSAFRNSGRSIRNVIDNGTTVTTNSPQTISEGLVQRSRWLTKSKAVGDGFASIFGLIVLLIQLAYYSFAFYHLSIGNFGASVVMIMIKGELDAFICTYKFQEQFNTLQVFVYELLFPVYVVVLIFTSVFYSSPWKGRV